jgi:hypothetical protein
MRSLIEAGRALTYSAFMHEDYKCKSEDKNDIFYHQRRIDLLTPLVKGWCTENSLEVTSLGLQIHGGMGFIEETGAAQHVRDARILPIYEGTNGIQALDLVGRKLSKDKGKAVMELIDELTLIVKDARAAKLAALADNLQDSLTACKEAVIILLTEGQEEWTVICSSAFNTMMLMGSTVAGAMLIKSAVVASKLNDENLGNTIFNKNKILTANFFADQLMPRNMAYLEMIKAGPKSTMALEVKDF